MNPSLEKKALVAIVIAVILAIAGFFYWQNYYTPPPKEEPTTEATSTDLGSEIYSEVTNPVEGELPDNPLEDVYKNPFE